MVSKQCEVEFNIGSYKDEVLCDVIPMDVCHAMLGMPWKYDKNFIHYGRNNTYTLEKNGFRHMLLPLEDKLVEKEANPSILPMSGKELLKEVKRDQEMHFSIIGKLRDILTNTSMNDLPIEIKEL
jgi:hypothetical protein